MLLECYEHLQTLLLVNGVQRAMAERLSQERTRAWFLPVRSTTQPNRRGCLVDVREEKKRKESGPQC